LYPQGLLGVTPDKGTLLPARIAESAGMEYNS
jgi:hypothetical protein